MLEIRDEKLSELIAKDLQRREWLNLKYTYISRSNETDNLLELIKENQNDTKFNVFS